MIVCFRCTAETRAYLDRLVSTGSYGDYDEAISAAVRNLALIEQEVGERGAIVIGTAPAQAAAPKESPAPSRAPAPAAEARQSNGRKKGHAKPARNGPAKGGRNVAAPVDAPMPMRSETPHVPPLFSLDGFPREEPPGLADLPPDIWAPGQMIPLDRWMLGQQNRLLPAKVNARALIRLFLESPQGLPISATAARVASEAAVLREYLLVLDVRHVSSRDEALATAFPTIEERLEWWSGSKSMDESVKRAFLANTAAAAAKSQARYANQFVVYQNSKGELSGLMVDLKLVNVVAQRKERMIVPTRVAWEFACLQNPVLDGLEGQAEKFSPEERSLLLRHIATSVTVEAFAYRVILEAVHEGNYTPDKIDAALKTYVTEDRAEKLTQSFLASQRSGAISRMSDLGLIKRQREGVRVSYAVTEGGLAFLNQSMNHNAR